MFNLKGFLFTLGGTGLLALLVYSAFAPRLEVLVKGQHTQEIQVLLDSLGKLDFQIRQGSDAMVGQMGQLSLDSLKVLQEITWQTYKNLRNQIASGEKASLWTSSMGTLLNLLNHRVFFYGLSGIFVICILAGLFLVFMGSSVPPKKVRTPLEMPKTRRFKKGIPPHLQEALSQISQISKEANLHKPGISSSPVSRPKTEKKIYPQENPVLQGEPIEPLEVIEEVSREPKRHSDVSTFNNQKPSLDSLESQPASFKEFPEPTAPTLDVSARNVKIKHFNESDEINTGESLRAKVVQLLHKGRSPSEIARQLQMSLDEVKIILKSIQSRE